MQLPLFGVLSGMVFSKTNSEKVSDVIHFTIKKFKSIYLPFVIWNLLFLLFHNVLYKINFIGHINGNEYYKITDFINRGFQIFTMGGGESLVGPLWYLIILLETTIVFCILLFLSNKLLNKLSVKTQMFIVLLACLTSMFIFANKDLPRNLSSATHLLVFYCIGYYLKEMKYVYRNISLKIMLPLDMILIIITIWCTQYSESWLSSNLIVVVVFAVCGIIPIIHISMLIAKHVKRPCKGIFVVIGKNSMGILALHLLMFCIVKTIYAYIYDLDAQIIATTGAISNFLWTPVYVIVGVAGSLLIYICIKFGVKYIKKQVIKLWKSWIS